MTMEGYWLGVPGEYHPKPDGCPSIGNATPRVAPPASPSLLAASGEDVNQKPEFKTNPETHVNEKTTMWKIREEAVKYRRGSPDVSLGDLVLVCDHHKGHTPRS